MHHKSRNSNLKTQSFLQEVVQLKKLDLIEQKKQTPLTVILNSIQDLKIPKQVRNDNLFKKVINSSKKGSVAIIAEIKFASPTNPNLGFANELFSRVKTYEQAGADAISIITEKHFFKGDLDFVTKVKKEINIPVLQKDFVIDEYQIYQAKIIGSDAILLIAKLVNKEILKRFVELAFEIGVEPVVEINSTDDLDKALNTTTNIIAVNARDLDTFKVDVNQACKLLKQIPDQYIKLGFSGVNSKTEVDQYSQSGAKGILVGTALMKSTNISEFISSLRTTEGSMAI